MKAPCALLAVLLLASPFALPASDSSPRVGTPSRYSLLTGQMAFRINYRSVFVGTGGPCLIRPDQLTMPQLLRDQGYATAMTGKWHVGLTFLDHDGQRITQGGVEGVKRINYARAIPGAALPPNAAEDSCDFLPVLLGTEKESGGAVRDYTLHQTISLALAIRRGSWKFLDHRGSGGNSYDNPGPKPLALPDTAPDAPGQLYNLATDPGETTNLYFQRPEIVRELKALLESTKASGRSAPSRAGTR